MNLSRGIGSGFEILLAARGGVEIPQCLARELEALISTPLKGK